MPKQDTGISPEEIFYSVKSDHSQLRETRAWGCPAYVLDPKLQDGKKIPKWKPQICRIASNYGHLQDAFEEVLQRLKYQLDAEEK